MSVWKVWYVHEDDGLVGVDVLVVLSRLTVLWMSCVMDVVNVSVLCR